jgi:hypothetical protein
MTSSEPKSTAWRHFPSGVDHRIASEPAWLKDCVDIRWMFSTATTAKPTTASANKPYAIASLYGRNTGSATSAMPTNEHILRVMHNLLVLILALAADDPIRAALVSGKLDDAAKLAQAKVSTDASFAACAVAIVEAQGDYKAASMLRKLVKETPAPPPAESPASAPLPKKGATVFVTASALVLRDKPSPQGKALTMLPIGTALKVLGGQNGFAEVQAPFPAGPSVLLDDGKVVRTGAPKAKGFVAAAFVGPATPGKAELAGQDDLALLERLVALDPSDTATVTRLAGKAYDEGKCAMAGHAAAILSGRFASTGGWRIERHAEVGGCKTGGHRDTVILDAAMLQDPARAPANACVMNVPANPKPCGYCPYDYGADPGDDEKEKAAQQQYEAEMAPYNALKNAFPQGPYVYVRLRRLSGAPEPVYAWSLAPTPQRPIGCGEPAPEDWDPGEPPKPSRSRLAIPKLQPGATVDIWVKPPEEGYGYGVVVGAIERVVAPTQEPQCCCD